MLWFNRHRRFQERLSAYMDGELAQRDARSVQTHLESCESCRRELAGLRVASAAMREMPDVDVPRSFALKPADVARPATRPATGMAHSFNSGLRLTGAGLAAVLALVLVLDVGGLAGGGDTGDSGNLSADDQMLGFAADAPEEDSKAAGGANSRSEDAAVGSGQEPSASLADNFQATPAPDGDGNVLTTVTPLAGYAASAGTPGSTGTGSAPPVTAGTPAATEMALPATGGETDGTQATADERAASAVPDPTPTPTATPSPSDPPSDAAAELGLNGIEGQDIETLLVSDSNVDSDGGPSALLVTEIVLAALLGASIVGISAATYAERRRR